MQAALREIRDALLERISPMCNDECCRPLRHLAEVADAALSAPPRNCDLYETENDARAAFDKIECPLDKRDCIECGEDPFTCELTWLFEEASQVRSDK